MTFSFSNTLSDDVSLVRFHTGDTNEDGHYLEDEVIQYFVSTQDVGHAVLAAIKYIITQLSSPNFSVGWMQVTNSEAKKGYEDMLIRKAQEFNLSVSGVTQATSIKNPMRADSYQTDSDYTGGLP